METRVLDGATLRRLLVGGAVGIRSQIKTINELNVFPVPDGDTGTNMTRTFESGIARLAENKAEDLGAVAENFAQGSLLGARGNSGVILSQFFAGVGKALVNKKTATPRELAEAYLAGVQRSYAAVAKPVEGTMLTVFRESVQYTLDNLSEKSTFEDFFSLTLEETKRSLARTKDMLPALTEADVVDSGGAGYLCIVEGMYESLTGKMYADKASDNKDTEVYTSPDYSLFTTDSTLEWGYCTEVLVRLQRAKGDPESFDCDSAAKALSNKGCNSIVIIRDGDILKLHAHTKTPSDILTFCQNYGEFLETKIENMSLQHSERTKRQEAAVKEEKKKPHKPYGIVTVAKGEGFTALFSSLGADIVIDGGQTQNPSTKDFLSAFEELSCDNIIVLPNNSNILLTAKQASELWEGVPVTIIPTKTLPEGYSALSVFNASVTDIDEQISDITSAVEAVISGEVTLAVRDTVVNSIEVKENDAIGILSGELVTAKPTEKEALISLIENIDDIDEREILTLFVGKDVSENDRADVTEAIEEAFPELTVEVFIGGQEIYSYVVAVE